VGYAPSVAGQCSLLIDVAHAIPFHIHTPAHPCKSTCITQPCCHSLLPPQAVAIDGKTLRFCYDRLVSLMKTLEITKTDDFSAVHLVADFATLVGTYARGFAIITEPYDERMPSVGAGLK